MFDIDSPEVLEEFITNKQTTAGQVELFGNVERYFFSWQNVGTASLEDQVTAS